MYNTSGGLTYFYEESATSLPNKRGEGPRPNVIFYSFLLFMLMCLVNMGHASLCDVDFVQSVVEYSSKNDLRSNDIVKHYSIEV